MQYVHFQDNFSSPNPWQLTSWSDMGGTEASAVGHVLRRRVIWQGFLLTLGWLLVCLYCSQSSLNFICLHPCDPWRSLSVDIDCWQPAT